MIHLVLCGGNGWRLWPLSNQGCPKSFLSFANHPSMRNRLLGVVANERNAAQTLSQAVEVQNDTASY
jgi:mannose-1-phosphate guanylyltransferase